LRQKYKELTCDPDALIHMQRHSLKQLAACLAALSAFMPLALPGTLAFL
jgi:hypothetical protein